MGAAVEYEVVCDEQMMTVCGGTGVTSACFDNVRWAELNIPLDSITGGAYIEYALAIEGTAPSPSYWSGVDILLGDDLWSFEPFTYRADGQYRLYQVKLSALRTPGGVPLRIEDLQGPLTQFIFAGFWPNGSTLRVDEVRVRW